MIKKKIADLSVRDKTIIVLLELLLVIILLAVFFFLRASYESGNVERYAKTDDIPVVTAERGVLAFNEVSVRVPPENASYVIGYDQASPDEEYPSVPSSASANYTDGSGRFTYEVVLYRDRVIQRNQDHQIYSLENWYEEWKPASSDGVSVQEAYSTPQTAGFLIRVTDGSVKKEAPEGGAPEDEASSGKDDPPKDETTAEAADNASKDDAPAGSDGSAEGEPSGGEKIYCSYTYYFAVETEKTIEQYVLELDYYDPKTVDQTEALFRAIADTITVSARKPA